MQQKYFHELKSDVSRNLALSFVWEGFTESGLTEIVLSVYASQPPGASVLLFSHPEFLRAHCGEWLQPNGCQIVQVFFSFSNVPRAQEFTFGGPEPLMTMTSLFTDMAGNTPYLSE